MTRSLSRRIASAGAAAAASMGAVALLATAAYAESPVRVAWWNMVSASGVVAPAPATPSGGIHVAAAPGQVLAYGALLYPLPAHASLGSLTLSIAGSQGTVQLTACPTKGTSWSAGDDQAGDSAPAYDCSAMHVSGAVAGDGKSVVFALTALPAGALSVAIVPDLTSSAGVNQPFSVDLDKPGPSSLNVVADTSTPAAPPAPTATTPNAPAAAPAKPSIAAGRPLALPKLPPSASTTQAAPAVTGAAPQIASGAPSTAPAGPQSVGASSRSAMSTAGSIVGVLALIAALMYWGLGRGLLGGRVQPLSIPTRSTEL